MDRSWMNLPRVSTDYRNGVQPFLNFSFANASEENKILCPCKKCANINWYTCEVVHEHLIVTGFVPGYRKWVFHGELTPRRDSSMSNPSYPPNSHRRSLREDDMEGMLRNAFNMHDYHQSVGEDDCDIGFNDFTEMGRSGCVQEPNGEAENFYNLLNEMSEPLYEGSKYSKLSFSIRLFHLKCLGGWTGNSFTQLLEFLNEMFPFAKIPQSDKDMKKIIAGLALVMRKSIVVRMIVCCIGVNKKTKSHVMYAVNLDG
ncbi:hypothetical protein HRI_004710600 [Hibiscus trionum]|uniref:Transposase-associated domain-containing protein n=1 Tax=Hibiscus trionum TaxID=183268 RepID=A0A9W7JBK0_HIBTR|nr:hypothetical protein HRI_004710600 [Hibiscus trionum]